MVLRIRANIKYHKFKVGDHVRILKYKNTFAKDYTPDWSEEVFLVKKVKNTVPLTYVITDLNGEEIAGSVKILWKRAAKDKPQRIQNLKSNQEKRQ